MGTRLRVSPISLQSHLIPVLCWTLYGSFSRNWLFRIRSEWGVRSEEECLVCLCLLCFVLCAYARACISWVVGSCAWLLLAVCLRVCDVVCLYWMDDVWLCGSVVVVFNFCVLLSGAYSCGVGICSSRSLRLWKLDEIPHSENDNHHHLTTNTIEFHCILSFVRPSSRTRIIILFLIALIGIYLRHWRASKPHYRAPHSCIKNMTTTTKTPPPAKCSKYQQPPFIFLVLFCWRENFLLILCASWSSWSPSVHALSKKKTKTLQTITVTHKKYPHISL